MVKKNQYIIQMRQSDKIMSFQMVELGVQCIVSLQMSSSIRTSMQGLYYREIYLMPYPTQFHM